MSVFPLGIDNCLFSVFKNLQKADKLALDNMISRLKFDASFGALEQSIQNILNRLSGQV